jgi:hypothetical protein
MQYLINLSMIWVFSLLAFDLFLKRESYHSYNRCYLLLTLVLGIVLPLLTWHRAEVVQHISFGSTRPFVAAINTKDIVVQAATIQPTEVIDWTKWLWIVWYTGIAIRILLLLKETMVLRRFFKTGKTTIEGSWQIVETGKRHGPFSFSKYIFISRQNDYTSEELRIIMVHEKEHSKQFHFIDTLMLEAIKIFLWFHPLVYLFQKRILTVHEYQADAAVTNEPNEYGHFLIRQSMLATAPVFSHSLNRSPIKKRIVMLTRKSSLTAGLKRLVIFPLGIVCIFLFTNNAISKDNKREGNMVYYNGNEFELQYLKSMPSYVENDPGYKLLRLTGVPDTFVAQNPSTGNFEKVVPRIDTTPVKMNGKDIYKVYDLAQADSVRYRSTTGLELRNFLTDALASIYKDAPDGYYGVFDYIILDDEGNLVYAQQPRVRTQISDYEKAAVKLEAKLFEAIKNTSKKFTPIKRSGKAEIMRVPPYTIEVNRHKVTIFEQSQYGC